MFAIAPFEDLIPNITTNTITVPLNTTYLNLRAIFLLIPVKNIQLKEGEILKVKSGKIIYPKYFNEPGTIISARYMDSVRGFIRSDKKAFPTSITLDVGTSLRILSIKFSQTIEVTGADGFTNAREAVECIVEKILDVERQFRYLKQHQEEIDRENLWTIEDPLHTIIRFFLQDRGTSEEALVFLDQFLLKFDGRFYDGELKSLEYSSEMLNIPFDLGFVVNQRRISEIVNKPPFYSFFSNVSSSIKVRIFIPYIKIKKGEEKIGFDYIKINRSGYILMIGHCLKSLEKIYYTFCYHVLTNLDQIMSPSKYLFRVNIIKQGSILHIDSYRQQMIKEQELKRDILTGKIPLIEECRLLELPA